MKESYVEGIADHNGPESCAGVREDTGEALTGESVGWVLSRETTPRCVSTGTVRGAEVVWPHRRQHRVRRHGKAHLGPARSETPCTRGRNSRGNREVPLTAATAWEGHAAARIVKPDGVRR